MKKRIFFVSVLLTLALTLAGSPVLADGPGGITGGVRFASPEWGVDQGWIRLTVHEVNPETQEAAGWVRWQEYNADGGWRHLSSQVICAAFGEDAGEDGQTAVFVVQVTSKRGWGALEPGQHVKFWVHDGGTPGSAGDEWSTLFWPADDDYSVPACGYEWVPVEYRVAVTGGNLVIHH
jgi:hypothetical protein